MGGGNEMGKQTMGPLFPKTVPGEWSKKKRKKTKSQRPARSFRLL